MTNEKAFVLDLSCPEEGLARVEFDLDGGNETVCFMHVCCGVGDVLFCTNTLEGNELYRLDLKAQTAKTLCTLPFEQRLTKTCSLYQGKLYFCCGFAEGKIVAVDAETGEMEIVNTAGPGQTLWYLPYEGHIFGAQLKDNGSERYGTAIYDINGNEIQSIDYEDYGENIYIYGVIGDYVLGALATNDPREKEIINYLSYHGPSWYLRVSDIGTDNLIWQMWAPGN